MPIGTFEAPGVGIAKNTLNRPGPNTLILDSLDLKIVTLVSNFSEYLKPSGDCSGHKNRDDYSKSQASEMKMLQ